MRKASSCLKWGGGEKTYNRFHIPSSAWQPLFPFSNNIQSTESCVLKSSMFECPASRSSCHLSPGSRVTHRAKLEPSGLVRASLTTAAYLVSRGRVLCIRLTSCKCNEGRFRNEGTGRSPIKARGNESQRQVFSLFESSPLCEKK